MTRLDDYLPAGGSPFVGWPAPNGNTIPPKCVHNSTGHVTVLHSQGIAVYRYVSDQADDTELLELRLPLPTLAQAYHLIQVLRYTLRLLGQEHRWQDGTWPDMFSLFTNEGIV